MDFTFYFFESVSFENSSIFEDISKSFEVPESVETLNVSGSDFQDLEILNKNCFRNLKTLIAKRCKGLRLPKTFPKSVKKLEFSESVFDNEHIAEKMVGAKDALEEYEKAHPEANLCEYGTDYSDERKQWKSRENERNRNKFWFDSNAFKGKFWEKNVGEGGLELDFLDVANCTGNPFPKLRSI